MHKRVSAARFIAGSASTTTARLAKVTSSLLVAVKREPKRKGRLHVIGIGVRWATAETGSTLFGRFPTGEENFTEVLLD